MTTVNFFPQNNQNASIKDRFKAIPLIVCPLFVLPFVNNDAAFHAISLLMTVVAMQSCRDIEQNIDKDLLVYSEAEALDLYMKKTSDRSLRLLSFALGLDFITRMKISAITNLFFSALSRFMTYLRSKK